MPDPGPSPVPCPLSPVPFFLSSVPELCAIVAICFAGFAARAWKFSTLGLTHFDEGVYALSGLWSVPSFHLHALYPGEKLFAPPAFFTLIGVAYRIWGASDLVIIGLNVACGTATIVLIWWMARRWCGAAAGIFSATLVALSEFNIAVSRSALTDTIFALLFLLSLALAAIWIERGAAGRAILFGLSVGAAWNVKYHGWLPLAIAALALMLDAALARREASHMRRVILQGILATAVALACFLPWIYVTQTRLGGYLAIGKFHSQFMDFRWGANFLRQSEMQFYFDGWLSRISPAFALLLTFLVKTPRVTRDWKRIALIAAALLISAAALGEMATCTVLAIFGCWFAWNAAWTASNATSNDRRFFGRLLVCAWLVLLLAVPCYTPYARLLLPWVLLTQLLAGIAMEPLLRKSLPRVILRLGGLPRVFSSAGNPGRRILRFLSCKTANICHRPVDSALASRCSLLQNQAFSWTDARPWFGLAALSVLILGVTSFGTGTIPGPRTWMSTASVRQAAGNLMALAPADSVVFVDQEPDIAFYFRRAGYLTFPINRFSEMRHISSAPTFLIVGEYARQTPDWTSVRSIPLPLQGIAEAQIEPGDIRLLDDLSPHDAWEHRRHGDSLFDLVIYRVIWSRTSADGEAFPGR